MLSDNRIVLDLREMGKRSILSVDLKKIAEIAGVRQFDTFVWEGKVERYSYIDYPLTKARRLCRMIAMYGSKEDREKAARYFEPNLKLAALWKDVEARYGAS